ncbi:MAG: hypothetical protein HY518_04515 [Candidatus Aenigmarchaeota archaeon]|nr:hypothetical protein [Candidatus Aenigmarchaeota archaeon]
MHRATQGILRTAEVLLAIAITLVVVSFAAPTGRTSGHQGEDFRILKNLEPDGEFRRCALERNSSCLNSTFAAQLPTYIEFAFNVSSQPSEKVSLPSRKNVFADSVFIAGNGTHYIPTFVRLYYWAK